MSETPERIWTQAISGRWLTGTWYRKPPKFAGDVVHKGEFVRADRYDEAIRERDELASALRDVAAYVPIRYWDASGYDKLLAACSPPLAPGEKRSGDG